MSDLCAIKGRKKRKKEGNRFADEEATKARARGSAADGLLNIIFSARENFSLFRSPTVVVGAFPRRSMRGRRAERFPLLSVSASTYRLACSRTRRAAPLFVLSFVKLDEISLLGAFPSFLFSSSLPRVVVDGRVD